MTASRLYEGQTAGGFFKVTLTLHVDEGGTLLELSSPRDTGLVPDAIHLDVEQARCLAAALLAGIDAAVKSTPDRCDSCASPIVGSGTCTSCEVAAVRRRRASLRAVP